MNRRRPDAPATLLKLGFAVTILTLFAASAAAQTPPYVPSPLPTPAPVCARTVTANVVALDQVYYWNRLGAFQPHGMIYALERDVVHVNQDESSCNAPQLALQAGNVKLRKDKRPRPLVLRANEGDCLRINFKNMLANGPADPEQPATRSASVHVVGLEYLTQGATGMNVGANSAGGVVPSGGQTSYTLYAKEEGTYLLYSGGAITGGEGDNGSIGPGLFGAVNVEPAGAEWYRSQVTEWDLSEATSGTVSGFPQINYNKTYPTSNPYCQPSGTPIFNMLQGNQIVHSDLTAIITGQGRQFFPASQFPDVGVYPNRNQSFREFTIIFHDEIGAVQAFPHFNDEILSHTLHSVRDAFAINYGTGGIGSEILANRLGVGPMYDCLDCLYEEFFLAAWTVGDAAMVVDKPANEPCSEQQIQEGENCLPDPGRKATKALYPDDPSNVYHSYINDHVKFRNLHAGSDDHHIFHLHAHQWVRSPDSDHSAYLDSQAIGQAGAFTYEIAYEGSGNRPKTVGDSIFHCHFYPHFAQGMWAMWRVHDVLETGTELDSEGKPIHTFGFAGGLFTLTRALPDAEILTGTPIPAIVPIPKLPMAPLPGQVTLVDGDITLPNPVTVNPGYPFFIPGKAGSRPPHPPLDFAQMGGQELNGGLRRHLVVGGELDYERHDRLSFEKHIEKINPLYLAEAGEPVEQVAMAFHSAGGYTTPTPDGGGLTGTFRVNQGGPQQGAPFADPCIDDNGIPIPNSQLRRYKAADIQMDLVLNKSGWHFPQQRLITLEQDVNDTLSGIRPPEPFFFRANSQECIEYWLTNLVPNEYEMDDFQVRTPTDILGQHIHLVKFDVTSSDGAANGWNYEDGTLSAEEVQDRILAIRKFHSCSPLLPITSPVLGRTLDDCPVAKQHPFFTPQGVDVDCDGHDDWLGAQTTIQRWWADPVWDVDGNDRTLHTIFTHDHFGPSTHQQAGLYAGLIIEPDDAVWYENESTGLLGGRSDGGPTSWQARIVSSGEIFREFALEFADFQMAYEPNIYGPPQAGAQQFPSCPDPNFGFMDFDNAVNPPGREQVDLPYLYAKPDLCPINDCDKDGPYPAPWFEENGFKYDATPGCPEAVSADDPGTGVVNYRQEPIPLRVRVPNTSPPQQASGEKGDLSFVYESRTDRADSDYNGVTSPHIPYLNPINAGILPGDPYTPLLRAYEDDRVHVRVLVGAHEEEHNFNFHGIDWLHEPDELNSGYRASQMMGLSEWYDFEIHRVPNLSTGSFADFLYKPSASNDMQWNGIWGLMRLYRGQQPQLEPLPDNLDARGPDEVGDDQLFATYGTAAVGAPVGEKAGPLTQTVAIAPAPTTSIPCPPHTLPPRRYKITAVAASTALPRNSIVYNSRETPVNTYMKTGPRCAESDSWVVSDSRTGALVDPSGVLFVRNTDLNPNGTIKSDVLIEPLVLRAITGECIEVELTNALPSGWTDWSGYSAVPMLIEQFNSNQVASSLDVGLHPQRVSVDVRHSDGYNVGRNRYQFGTTPVSPKQTVSPGQSIKYYWYAGDLFRNGSGGYDWEEYELGATALVSSDPIKHTQNGTIGSLIVEPPGSSWTLDRVVDRDGITKRTYSRATVTTSFETFREFVVHYQDDINLVYLNGADSASITVDDPERVKSLNVGEDAQETGQAGFNYRTEPVWFRLGYDPDSPAGYTRTIPNYHLALHNSLIGGDPETPIFPSTGASKVRMRVLHPGGDTQNHSFELHGHLWQEEPWIKESHYLGYNPISNWRGAETGVGTGSHMNVLLGRASPQGAQTMDYLYRDYIPWATHNGLWGLLRIVGFSPAAVQWTPPQ